MRGQVLVLVTVMGLSGVFGGLVNYVIAARDDAKARWWRSVVVGVCASFTVPLFLTMVSSSLVENVLAGDAGKQVSSVFVFAGFCLVAAISAQAFLRSISDRVLRDVQQGVEEAKGEARLANIQAGQAVTKTTHMESVLEPIVARQTEPEEGPPDGVAAEAADETPTDGLPASPAADASESLSPNAQKVLDAFRDASATYRSVSGISKDVQLPKEAVREALHELVAAGLVAAITRDKGVRWAVANEGIRALAGTGK